MRIKTKWNDKFVIWKFFLLKFVNRQKYKQTFSEPETINNLQANVYEHIMYLPLKENIQKDADEWQAHCNDSHHNHSAEA